MHHKISEAQTALEDLHRETAELEAEVEASEVRHQVDVSDLIAMGDGLRDELGLSRNQVEALKSDLKGIWVKHCDACAVLKFSKTKLGTMVRQIEADRSILRSNN